MQETGTRERKRTWRWFWPVIVFAASLAVYLPMLPSAVSFEDAGEFVAVAKTLGIAHPSGYPLYALLGHLFTFLPFGSVPWRVALLSAFAAAGAAAFACAAVQRLVLRRYMPAPAVGTLIALPFLTLAMSETWWSQAITAEVYPLHALFVAAIGYALVVWAERGGIRWGALASFLFGLAMSNHLFLTLPVAPVILGIVLYLLPRGKRLKGLGICLGAGMLGLLPYLLLPLRSGSGAFAMGDASTVGGFLAHVLRLRYGDVGTPAWNKMALALGYLKTVLVDLGPLLAALAVGASVLLVRSRERSDRAAAAWFIGLVLVVPVVVAVRGLSWRPVIEYLYQAYAVPGLLAVAALASYGAVAVYRSWIVSEKRWRGTLVVLLFAVVPVFTAVAAGPRVAEVASSNVEASMRAYMDSLPRDAVLVMNDYGLTGDTELFVMAYLQLVEGVRTDVAVVTDTAIRNFTTAELPGGYAHFPLDVRRRLLLRAVLADPAFEGRPLYTSWPATGMETGWRSFATGYAYAFGARPAAMPVPPATPNTNVTHPTLRAFASHELYAGAGLALEEEGVKAAMPWVVKAIELDPEPQSSDYLDFVRHRAALIEAGALPAGAEE